MPEGSPPDVSVPVGETSGRWPRLAALDPSHVAGGVLLLSLAAAPLVSHHYDVMRCFLPWARATEGWRPWGVYDPGLPVACDYPPLIPYLLTLVEAARRWLGAGQQSALTLVLLKLPVVLAWLALAPLCLVGLRRPFGLHDARLAAVLCALSAPLWINAALWGQLDSLVTLFVAMSVIALLNERPMLAGASLGLALASKMLAAMALPVLGVWCWRRFGPQRTLQSAAACVLVVAALALPHVAGGAGRQVASAYTGAVGAYPVRTAQAYNGWYLLDRFDFHVRGVSPEDQFDSRPVLGLITFRHLGLLALGAYTIFLVTVIWRHPTPDALVAGVALGFFAFFMLPTESRERYLVHAAALFALAAGRSRPAALLFVGLSITSALNEGLVLARAVLGAGHVLRPVSALPSLVALANVTLFVWISAGWRRLFGLA